MLIGVPKEIKKGEYRVGLIPTSVHELVNRGHRVMVEHNAGHGIGFDDDIYKAMGATITDNPREIYQQAEMIVKVKEPQSSEYTLLHPGQILFAYLHLAPDPQQAQALIDSKCIAIAYETVTDKRGGLPLLTPMSEVAGRFSIQAGAHCLEKKQGGSGILLGGVPGVSRANVTIIGGGVVGTNAARMAIGSEANVIILDKSLSRLRELDEEFGSCITTLFATDSSIEESVIEADLVIGAVLIPGASTPRLVTREMLKKMRPNSVVVDVSIDQGGCFETSRPTTFDDPTYVVENIVHYCVTNMPGGVPRTATLALNNATLPFVVELADKGYKQALLDDIHLLNGLNVYQGSVAHRVVASALNKEYVPAQPLLMT